MPTTLGIRFITTFGLGFLRPASGTWGSLPPAIVAGGLVLAHAPILVWMVVQGAFLVIFSAACLIAGDEAEARFGKKDPGQVVADETAGMALTLMVVPFFQRDTWHDLALVAGAFVSFRVADIVKPLPADRLQSLPGGPGILMDDLIAGLYAAAALAFVAAFF